MAAAYGALERSDAPLAPLRAVGTARREQFHHFQTPFGGRNVEWRLTGLRTLFVVLRAVRDQHLGNPAISPHRRLVERRRARMVARIHIGALRNQMLSDFQIAAVYREVQRRGA